jgi:hypothetical protein
MSERSESNGHGIPVFVVSKGWATAQNGLANRPPRSKPVRSSLPDRLTQK